MRCKLCKSLKISNEKGKVRDNSKLKIKRCNNCNLIFLSTNSHIHKNYYRNSEMLKSDDPSFSFNSWRKQTLQDDKRRFNQFKKMMTDKKILDFGCGNGNFLHYIKNISKATGVEIDRQSLDIMKKENLNVYESINKIPKDQKFEIITLFHVFEHLKNPKKILNSLYPLLKNNGRIIIEIPNSNDSLLSIYDNKNFRNFTFWSNHLYLYDSENFPKALNSNLYSIEDTIFYQRYPIENHLYWLLEGSPGGHEIWKNKVNNSFKRFYNNILIKKKATDTLIFIIKKK